MSKRACILFDFDGTLYPIAPYDSEQRLLRRNAQGKGTLFKMRTKRLIAQDQAGTLIEGAFHRQYANLIRGVTPQMICEVARDLTELITATDVQALKALAQKADLAIVTCGTENLAASFLSQLGLENHFFLIRGKQLVWDEKGKNRLVVDIDKPEAKAKALEELRSQYDTIIAVGDGPTDIPMLQASDLGLIIAWNQNQRAYPFETHTSLSSISQRIHTYLVSACEA